MQRSAERRDLLDARPALQRVRHLVEPRPLDHEGRQPGIRHHLVHGAGGQQLAVGNIADAVAAFGLVHIVRRHQHGQPAARQAVDLVPELAPRLGIDARRRLVEQKQLRLMHDAGGQRQALLPAARQRAGKLVAPRTQAQIIERAADILLHRPQPVEPGHEFEILGDCQILVEREFLRHVADLALDLEALGQKIVAEHLAFALVRRQKPAHDADRGRLARAVRPQEPNNLALGDVHRDMVDDGLGAEALDEIADFDGVHDAAPTACGE